MTGEGGGDEGDDEEVAGVVGGGGDIEDDDEEEVKAELEVEGGGGGGEAHERLPFNVSETFWTLEREAQTSGCFELSRTRPSRSCR